MSFLLTFTLLVLVTWLYWTSPSTTLSLMNSISSWISSRKIMLMARTIARMSAEVGVRSCWQNKEPTDNPIPGSYDWTALSGKHKLLVFKKVPARMETVLKDTLSAHVAKLWNVSIVFNVVRWHGYPNIWFHRGFMSVWRYPLMVHVQKDILYFLQDFLYTTLSSIPPTSAQVFSFNNYVSKESFTASAH